MNTQLLKKLCAVTDIIGDSFNVFFKNIVNLLWFQLIYIAAILVCAAPVWIYVMLRIAPLFKDIPQNMPPEQAQQLMAETFKVIASDPAVWLLSAAMIIILIIAASWKMAAVSAYLESKLLGTPLNITESFKKAYSRVVPFAVTLFSVGLLVYAAPLAFAGVSVFAFIAGNYALGALCVLGAFAAAIASWFVFVAILPLPQVLALKGKNYTDAVKYAWRLVKGRYWPAVGFFLLIIAVMFGFGIAAMIAQMIVQVIGALLTMIASIVPFFGIIVMILMFLAVMLIQILPQCYMDVPLVMYYVNREALNGDGAGPVAAAAQSAPETPQQPDARNEVRLETPPQN